MPLWLFVTLSFSGSAGLANVQPVVLFAGKVVDLSGPPSLLSPSSSWCLQGVLGSGWSF